MNKIMLSLAGVGMLILLLVGATGHRAPAPPAWDLGYFHAMPGHASPSLELGDANMQVKAVAARRHATVAEVRHLLQQSADNSAGVPLADRRVDLQDLNQKLDERWPMK